VSGETLRALEHRWRTTRSPEDEVCWLRERLRRGELEPSRLLLPAYLGYPAARALCDPEALEELGLDAWDPPSRRLAKLSPFAREARVRIAIAAAHFGLSADEAPSPAARRALSAAEAWVRCPCRAHALAAESVLRVLGTRRSPSERAARAAAEAVASRPTNGAREAVACVDTGLAGNPARVAIATELAAWSLGYPDPLLARTEARSRAGLAGDCCGYRLPHSEHVELEAPVIRVSLGPTRLCRALGRTRSELNAVLQGRSWLVLEQGGTSHPAGTLIDELTLRESRGRPGFRAETNAEAIAARLGPEEAAVFVTQRLPDLRERPSRTLAAATTALAERNERLGKLRSVDAPETILRRERWLLQRAAAELEAELGEL
jgi:hypothetical protein